jgi:putative transposase
MQHKSFKYRIYPTKLQQEFLAQQFGAVRFVYNHFLANRKDEYLNNKKSLTYYDDAVLLTKLKKQDGYNWLYDINAQTLQSSIRNLDKAYKAFFKKKAKFPKFHKKSNRQCIKIPQRFYLEENKLWIPKLRTGLEIVQDRELPSKPKSVSISKTPPGKYYASFLCEVDNQPLKQIDKVIGIDLGIKNLLICSDNQVFNNPKYYRKLENKLKYKQRQLSKKKKGSNNRNKQRLQVAKLHEYVANCRKDNLHKISKKLIDENQVIILEDLAVKNIIKNPKLAKSIQDASWGELSRQLEYKSKWYGRTFHKIDRFFPSSKTCNNCKQVVDFLPLDIREWNCPSCNSYLDRDLNAAINIRDEGLANLKKIAQEELENKLETVSGSGIESDKKQKLVEASAGKGSRRNKKSSVLC